MKKGFVLVDIPETCRNCLFSRHHAAPLQDCVYCIVSTQGVIREHQIKRPNWCPIKPLSKEVEMQSFCCGTCKYHVPSEVPGDGDWVCDNAESEYYGIETGNADGCMDYEERE